MQVMTTPLPGMMQNTTTTAANKTQKTDGHNQAETPEEIYQQRITDAAKTFAEFCNDHDRVKEDRILDNFSTSWGLDRLIEHFTPDDKTTIKKTVLFAAMASTNNQSTPEFPGYFDPDTSPDQIQASQALLINNSEADHQLILGEESMSGHCEKSTKASINSLLKKLNSVTQLGEDTATELRNSIITTLSAIKYRTTIFGKPTPPPWHEKTLTPELTNNISTANAISVICDIDRDKVSSILSDIDGGGFEENNFTSGIVINSADHAFPNSDDITEIPDQLFLTQKNINNSREILYLTMIIARSYHPPLTNKDENEIKAQNELNEKFKNFIQNEYSSYDLVEVLKCLDILQQMTTEQDKPITYNVDYIKAKREKIDQYLITFYKEFDQKTAEQKKSNPLTASEYFADTRVEKLLRK